MENKDQVFSSSWDEHAQLSQLLLHIMFQPLTIMMVLAVVKANHTQNCVGKSIDSRSRDGIISPYSALTGYIYLLCPGLSSPVQKRHWKNGVNSAKNPWGTLWVTGCHWVLHHWPLAFECSGSVSFPWALQHIHLVPAVCKLFTIILLETVSKVVLSLSSLGQLSHHRRQSSWFSLGKFTLAVPSHLLVIHMPGNGFQEDFLRSLHRNWWPVYNSPNLPSWIQVCHLTVSSHQEPPPVTVTFLKWHRMTPQWHQPLLHPSVLLRQLVWSQGLEYAQCA